jgi:hypothetical protein
MGQFTNLDANGSAFFNRQLELIKSRSYDVLYADLIARSLFPVSSEGGLGITAITYRTYDQVGMAKLINNYAGDLPRADIEGKETTIPVKELGISFGYTVKEIESSRLTGLGLDQRRGNAARRGNEQMVNDIAYKGDSDAGLPGFLTNPNIPVTAVGGGDWASKTPDEILFDINDLFADVFENTKMKERADTLLIPPSQWSLISSTARSANSDTTILQYIVQNSPFLNSADNIIPVNELIGAGNYIVGGTPDADVMVAYTRSPDKLQLEIPFDLQFMAPQERGLEIIIPGISSIAGVNVYYPLSAAFAEGI